MSKRRVLFVSSQHLFGESVKEILRAAADVELIGPVELNEQVCGRIREAQPHVVVVADEDARGEESTRLTAAIIEEFPELPVIRANLSENVVRIFSTHILPARGADLIETIRSLPARKLSTRGAMSNERN